MRALTAPQTITVTVTNAQEAGTVSLSPDPPTVDKVLTASLSDPDGGVTNPTWTWQTAASSTGPWTPIDGATAASYTPVTADARQYLRATTSYDDAQATGQSAQAVSAEVRSINADLRAILVNGAAIAGFDPGHPLLHRRRSQRHDPGHAQRHLGRLQRHGRLQRGRHQRGRRPPGDLQHRRQQL